jgi:hypothetical protein
MIIDPCFTVYPISHTSSPVGKVASVLGHKYKTLIEQEVVDPPLLAIGTVVRDVALLSF